MSINLKASKILPSCMMAIFAIYNSLALGEENIWASYIMQICMMLSFFYSSFLIIRKRCISTFIMFNIILFSFIAVMSIINNADWKNWIYYSCCIVFMLNLFNYYEDNITPLLIGALLGFSLSIYLGLFDMIIHPEMWIMENSKESSGYLLGGNYNQIGSRLLCALITNILCLKISKWYIVCLIPLCIACIAILFMVQSMTALSCIILFFLLCFITNQHIQRICIYILLIVVILFEIFVCFQGKGFENNELARWFIVDILGKDMTFTYRTSMWDSAIRIISESPLWGYGFVSNDWYITHMSSTAVGPHNIILSILIQGGIIALILYLYIVFLTFREILVIKDRMANIILCSICILFLMMLMEVYPMQLIIYMLALAYHYNLLYSSKKKKVNL